MTSYSPGDNVVSPTSGLLLDTSKDNPENFLVQLTPETSPKKCTSVDLGTTASPTLEKKISKSNLVEFSEEQVEVVEKKPVNVVEINKQREDNVTAHNRILKLEKNISWANAW